MARQIVVRESPIRLFVLDMLPQYVCLVMFRSLEGLNHGK